MGPDNVDGAIDVVPAAPATCPESGRRPKSPPAKSTGNSVPDSNHDSPTYSAVHDNLSVYPV